MGLSWFPGKITGERKCWTSCPYGVPQFKGDARGLKMSKCDMCIDRLEQGDKPICVLSCSLRALEFGPLEELKVKYGTLNQLEDMPRGSITRPAAVFKPADPKKEIVPYDSNKALQLLQKRQPDGIESLPDVFTNLSDITCPSDDVVARNRLVLKPQNIAEHDYYTMDDE